MSDYKYIILVGDGMSGHPVKDLEGRTTLESAQTPTLDLLTRQGIGGLIQNVPEGLPPGSDVACCSIFGYDPRKYYPGRAPLEAAVHGIQLEPNDVAFRCNLVTINKGIMQDFTAGHISQEDSVKAIALLQAELGSEDISFHHGVSYRNLMVFKNGPLQANCTPPHDITGKRVAKYLPSGNGIERLTELKEQADALLQKAGLPANAVWFWGQGKIPSMPRISEKFNIHGGVITAVDLLKGLGKYAGLVTPQVKGATGFTDTNYKAKVKAGLDILSKAEFLLIHIEAPDECGHMGDYKEKIRAIEDFDSEVVTPVYKQLTKQKQPFRVVVLPDHPTPVELKTHSNEPVPFVFYDSENLQDNPAEKFCEKTMINKGLLIEEGYTLLERIINADF